MSKFGSLSRNSSPPLVSQAGYGPADMAWNSIQKLQVQNRVKENWIFKLGGSVPRKRHIEQARWRVKHLFLRAWGVLGVLMLKSQIDLVLRR